MANPISNWRVEARHCRSHHWLVYSEPDTPCRECINCGRIEVTDAY